MERKEEITELHQRLMVAMAKLQTITTSQNTELKDISEEIRTVLFVMATEHFSTEEMLKVLENIEIPEKEWQLLEEFEGMKK